MKTLRSPVPPLGFSGRVGGYQRHFKTGKVGMIWRTFSDIAETVGNRFGARPCWLDGPRQLEKQGQSAVRMPRPEKSYPFNCRSVR